MNYELYMGAALAEARAAAAAGERPDGAVAVLDDAMVAHGREQVQSTGDPTAHAVILVLREAARRLGRPSLSGLTVFVASEPCAMCVGALLESDADGLVYALADPRSGACGSVLQVAHSQQLPHRLRVVSGIMQAQAEDLRRVATVPTGNAGRRN
ncbi:MAG TPA: nucleoside deaminase [Candidatus Caenarcaniphilales bacterium]|nr:nucleoside deaminase [Candidatus Caenarcaniphilales bacterium]